MEPRATGQFIDDFIGGALIDNRYNETVLNGSAFVVELDYDDGDNGVVCLESEEGNGDNVLLRTYQPVNFSRGKGATVRARFQLKHTSSILAKIGFMYDADNWIAFVVDTATTAKWRIGAALAAAETFTSHADDCDTDWHWLELRLLGASGSAELVLDGDEASKVTIADANLPDQRLYLFGSVETTAALAPGGVRQLYVDQWAVAQARLV